MYNKEVANKGPMTLMKDPAPVLRPKISPDCFLGACLDKREISVGVPMEDPNAIGITHNKVSSNV